MNRQDDKLGSVAKAFIAAANASDVKRVLELFILDAVIDDPSTGYRFDGHVGICDYIERYFIGYHHDTLSFLTTARQQQSTSACGLYG